MDPRRSDPHKSPSWNSKIPSHCSSNAHQHPLLKGMIRLVIGIWLRNCQLAIQDDLGMGEFQTATRWQNEAAGFYYSQARSAEPAGRCLVSDVVASMSL